MNLKNPLRGFATLLYLTVSAHVVAIDIQKGESMTRSSGIWHHYLLSSEGKPDERFKFDALQESERRWDLYVMLFDTLDEASEPSFKEYTEVLYHCVDRFVSDVPEGAVWTVHIQVTRDSNTWKDIRKALVTVLGKRTGFAISFPKGSSGVAEWALNRSPEIKEIGRQLEKRLKRKYAYSGFTRDNLNLMRRTHEDYTRTWQDVVKLPDLSLDMSSLAFEMDFEPLGEAPTGNH